MNQSRQGLKKNKGKNPTTTNQAKTKTTLGGQIGDLDSRRIRGLKQISWGQDKIRPCGLL